MKRLLGLVAVFLLALPIVMAGGDVNETLPPGNSTVPRIDPIIQDFTTIYHYDSGSGVGRNADYPEYEYVYAGDNVHFWAKIQDKTIYNLEHETVIVHIDCPTETIDVPLEFVTGIGAVYEPQTGLYNGEFEGDFMMPSATELSGLCTLSVEASNPTGGNTVDDLQENKYVNVNDILANPVVTIDAGPAGLSFVLVPNQYNRATFYPIRVAIDSEDDSEGQGVIGNLSIAATDLVGVNDPTDVIQAWNIRMKTQFPVGGLGNWVNLMGNDVLGPTMNATLCGISNHGNSTHTCYTLVDTEVATDGNPGDYQLFFELYFDSNHRDTQFVGGALGIKYSIY